MKTSAFSTNMSPMDMAAFAQALFNGLSLSTIGLLLLMSTPQLTDSVQIISCHSGSFYNPQLRSCQICRKCPKDEIIKEPCSTLQDTNCGPFEGFNPKDLEHVQPPPNTQGGAPSNVVPAGLTGDSDGATKDYARVSWKNIILISLGFFMTFSALIAIIVIVIRMVCFRKRARILQYSTSTEGPNVVVVKRVTGEQQPPNIAKISSLLLAREELNPLYDVTNSDETSSLEERQFRFKLFGLQHTSLS